MHSRTTRRRRSGARRPQDRPRPSLLPRTQSTSSRKMSRAWLAFGRRVSWQRRSPNSTGDGRVSLATRQPLASLRRCNASTAGPEAAGRAIRQTRKAPPARHAGGPRHPFENLFLRAADRGGCRSRVADRGLSIESVSSCQTAARALMCRLAGAPHAAAERAAAPLAPSTWPPTACGVPAERDPVSEHVVPTRRGELTRAQRAISTLAPRATGPRPTGSMWRTCSCSAVVVARSLAERPLIRRLHYYPWRAAECLGASRSLPCQDTGGRGVW